MKDPCLKLGISYTPTSRCDDVKVVSFPHSQKSVFETISGRSRHESYIVGRHPHVEFPLEGRRRLSPRISSISTGNNRIPWRDLRVLSSMRTVTKIHLSARDKVNNLLFAIMGKIKWFRLLCFPFSIHFFLFLYIFFS